MQSASSIHTDAAPFDDEQTAQIVEDYNRDGFCLIPGVLQADEIAALRAGVDRIFDSQKTGPANNRLSDFIAVRLFETDPIFEEMLTREPIISLVEKILGEDCHIIAQNTVRNNPGQALDFFHVDDRVMFPVADGQERHLPGAVLPNFILTVQMLLTDVEAVEFGPTEYVPGSHFSGREPNSKSDPKFEGHKAVPVLCKAGDIYLHNGQCWHRGAPNTSNRTRYLLHHAFGQRWVSQRFYPFLNYKMPEHVIANADARRLRVLGAHPSGAYG